MKKILTHPYTLLFFRFALGGLFIYTSLDKIQNPQEFSDLIDNYHVTPILINNIVALSLPWVELIIGIGLISGIYLDAVLHLTILLLVWFIFILAQAVIRGIDTHCGCFKVDEAITNTDFKGLLIKRIIEDVIFLGMALIVKFRYKINKVN